MQSVWGAVYREIPNDAGDLKDVIDIPFPLAGDYSVQVIPDDNATADETFSITAEQDGIEKLLVDNERIGNVTHEPYIITVTSHSPAHKNECKDNGWRTFNNPVFKNQGDCVSYVIKNRENQADRS